jgi:hypothetical protein
LSAATFPLKPAAPDGRKQSSMKNALIFLLVVAVSSACAMAVTAGGVLPALSVAVAHPSAPGDRRMA